MFFLRFHFSFVFSSVVSTRAIVGKIEIAGCRDWQTRFFAKMAGRGFRGKWEFVDFAGFEEWGPDLTAVPYVQEVSYFPFLSSSSSFSFIFIASATLVSIM